MLTHSGFTYKNRHSSEFGALAKTKERSLLPETKSYTYDSPIADGSYDFTEANRYGRAFYKNRAFEVILQIAAANLTELTRKAAKIAIWLTGSGDLIFDDTAPVKWRARVVSDVAFTPERRGKTAEISVIFQTLPVGRAAFCVSDGICLGDAVYLDSDIPLDTSGYFTKTLKAGENKIDFVNIGDFYARPKLRFIGDIKNTTIAFRDNKIILEDLTNGAEADFEKCVVTDNGGSLIADKMQGDFFELPPGRSVLEIYADSPGVLEIDYTPGTIYDFDFSEIDWGDGDA